MDPEIAHAEETPAGLDGLPADLSAEAEAKAEGVGAAVAVGSEHVEHDSPVLRRMMRMADRYRAENLTREATEMYFALLKRAGDAPETAHVQERLLEIAEEYESVGEPHQARGIYDRLLYMAQPRRCGGHCVERGGTRFSV